MKTDEQVYDEILDSAGSAGRFFDPADLEAGADRLEQALISGQVVKSPESDPESDSYQGRDYVYELRSSAARIRRELA
jgi:hypothetical protein